MPKKNMGFTIMELLAAITILGIMVTVTIPIVMAVMNNQKNEKYVEDSIRLVSVADYKMRSDNKIRVPAINSCIVMSLSYLDDDTFEDAPSGGKYDKMRSFVVAKRAGAGYDEEYFFYVRLVENVKSSLYKGVSFSNVNDLYRNDAADNYVVNISNVGTILLSPSYDKNVLRSKVNGLSGISCDSIVEIYVSDEINKEGV